MNYPSNLIKRVKAACQEIEEGLASRVFPFDYRRQVERYQKVKGDLLKNA